MISKERLEELIEQRATIWGILGKIEKELKLNEDDYGLNYKDELVQRCYYDDYFYKLKDLFETKEELEWYMEFGCIERTERLELPTWEEVFEKNRLLDCYTQEFAIVKDLSVIGVALFGVDFTNKIIEVSIGSDKLFVEELTKENYTHACRKAKSLFLGEKDE